MTDIKEKMDELMNAAFSYEAPAMPDFSKVGEISEAEKDDLLNELFACDEIVAAGCKNYAAKFCKNVRNNTISLR